MFPDLDPLWQQICHYWVIKINGYQHKNSSTAIVCFLWRWLILYQGPIRSEKRCMSGVNVPCYTGPMYLTGVIQYRWPLPQAVFNSTKWGMRPGPLGGMVPYLITRGCVSAIIALHSYVSQSPGDLSSLGLSAAIQTYLSIDLSHIMSHVKFEMYLSHLKCFTKCTILFQLFLVDVYWCMSLYYVHNDVCHKTNNDILSTISLISEEPKPPQPVKPEQKGIGQITLCSVVHLLPVQYMLFLSHSVCTALHSNNQSSVYLS